MMTITGNLVCTNCGAISPGKDHLESRKNATESGWIDVADDICGCMSIYHFCDKCGEAAQARIKESEEEGLTSHQREQLTRNALELERKLAELHRVSLSNLKQELESNESQE